MSPVIEEFFHGHKTKSKVFGHTHKKMVLKIFNYFLSISFLLLKIYFFMCVTKHFLFGHVTILKFLPVIYVSVFFFFLFDTVCFILLNLVFIFLTSTLSKKNSITSTPPLPLHPCLQG